ncbi:MAG: NTF2 fold immunity protein [Deltaproteobacteria bacterium]|nr:NTF2 fold immunity protein [Deltaproteobacteria bacterium]
MKNKKIIILLSMLLVFFLLPILYAAEAQKHNYKPASGYVPDEETAIKIAVAVWTPIYGKEKIEKEKPFKATLKDGIWYVNGSLPKEWNVGGVAEAEISKDDGRIIRVSHGK